MKGGCERSTSGRGGEWWTAVGRQSCAERWEEDLGWIVGQIGQHTGIVLKK